MTGFLRRFGSHPKFGDPATAQRWVTSKTQAQHLQRRLRQSGLSTTYLAIRRGFVGASRFKICQWIDGIPDHTDNCKCGQPTKDGGPYCERHDAIAHTKPETETEKGKL